MRLNVRQLVYFAAIAERGALSHAAQTLNVAQSALSHHVAQMEAELGVQLLERRARGISLTPAGQRLYEHARIILEAMKSAEDDVKAFSEDATGRVSVGLTHTAVDLVALPFMQAVRKGYPGVVLGLSEGLSPRNLTRVLDGEIDLALVYNAPEDARLSRRPLLREEMCLVGRRDVVGETGRPIAFADIPHTAILTQYSSGAMRAMVDSHLLRSKLTTNETLEIDSLVALRAALGSGFGCAILSRASITAQITSGSLSARPIVRPVLMRTLEQISLHDRPKTRAFIEVARTLTTVIQQEAHSGRWPAKVQLNSRH